MNNELLKKLVEIRQACAEATSPADANLNMIMEEIDRLASICIDALEREAS